jgi:hypothetical protein
MDTIFPTNIARCSLLPESPFKHEKNKFLWREQQLTPEQAQQLKNEMSNYMTVNINAGEQLALMGLSAAEKQFVKNLMARPVQVRFAMSISRLGNTTTRRLLFWLLEKKIFVLSKTNPEGTASVPENRLKSTLERMRSMNEFDLLCVHATTSPADIQQRAKKMLKDFDISLYPAIKPESRTTLLGIHEIIKQAALTLKDDTQRRAVRDKRWSQFQIDNFFDIQIKKASIALKMRMDPDAAIALAESALELKPENPTAFGILTGAKQLKKHLPPGTHSHNKEHIN